MRKYGDINWNENVLLVSYPSFEPTTDEYKEYLQRLDQFLTQKDSFSIVYDTSLSKYLSAENRIQQSKWVKVNTELIKNRITKMTFVIPSISVRLVLKTILTFSPLPCPHEVVAKMEDIKM